MYKVFGAKRTRALRVLWMLEELGETYEHVAVPPRSDAVKLYNQTGKVPVLLVDDVAITDSSAILTYLADRHGRFAAPAGSIERGRQDAMLHRVLDEMDAILWTAARHSFILPEERRVTEVKPTCKWEFEKNVAQILEEVQTEYLCGTVPTVADFVFAHCCVWAQSAKFPISDEFRHYANRMLERPAYVNLTSV